MVVGLYPPNLEAFWFKMKVTPNPTAKKGSNKKTDPRTRHSRYFVEKPLP